MVDTRKVGIYLFLTFVLSWGLFGLLSFRLIPVSNEAFGMAIASMMFAPAIAAMMIQMALLVLLPLLLGLFLRPKQGALLTSLQRGIPVLNQCLILSIVWMGLSEAKETVLSGGAQVFVILVLSFLFHAALLVAGFLAIRLFHIPWGRLESILFMGGQKTLPLSVLLQVKLFPQYGLALAFCVFHHFIHLMMDGYLVGRLNRMRKG